MCRILLKQKKKGSDLREMLALEIRHSDNHKRLAGWLEFNGAFNTA